MHRLMLERKQHGDCTFATLTYTDEAMPLVRSEKYVNGLGTLNPKHIQDWLKRLRKAISPRKIRFYAVGEYGDISFRPHYHVALFNYPCCVKGRSEFRRDKCCEPCNVVRETWGFGNIILGQLEEKSAAYIARYVLKKMRRTDDARLEGRWPEFARMSLRPGIGVDAMHDVASVMMQYGLDEVELDVPAGLRHGKKVLPLGRHLRRKLRVMIGREEGCPQDAMDEIEVQMRPLREAARASSDIPSLSGQVVKANEGKRASMMARSKIYKGRTVL